jgi:hypothetical protein
MWENILKIYGREIVWWGMDWIHLEQVGTGGGLFWTRQWTFGFHKILANSWLNAQQVTCQQWLNIMGLVSWMVSENSKLRNFWSPDQLAVTGSIYVRFLIVRCIVSVRRIYSVRTDNISIKIHVGVLVFIMECDWVYEESDGSIPCRTWKYNIPAYSNNKIVTIKPISNQKITHMVGLCGTTAIYVCDCWNGISVNSTIYIWVKFYA